MNRRLYSYSVWSPDEAFFKEHLVALGPGTNAFTVSLLDVEAFRTELKEAGVKVLQENVLDEFEAIDPNLEVPELVAARQDPRLRS
jgi:hypothetical protein